MLLWDRPYGTLIDDPSISVLYTTSDKEGALLLEGRIDDDLASLAWLRGHLTTACHP
jgi:hypothetical protein